MYLQMPNDSSSEELTHAEPKMAGGRDTISWSFLYRAPQTVGVVDTLYATGNSVDLNLDPLGDYWNIAANFHVLVTSPSDVGDEEVVRSFALHQNYPNPFNPSTTITFDLSVVSRVVLSVYDVTGKRLKTLVDGEHAAGSHELQFGADQHPGLSSGIYHYRIEVEPEGKSARFVATKKMILLK
jgi:hypothetical protein